MKKYVLVSFVGFGNKLPRVIWPIFKGEDGHLYYQQLDKNDRIEIFLPIENCEYNKLLKSGNFVKINNADKLNKVVSVGDKQFYGIQKEAKKLIFASNKVMSDLLKQVITN